MGCAIDAGQDYFDVALTQCRKKIISLDLLTKRQICQHSPSALDLCELENTGGDHSAQLPPLAGTQCGAGTQDLAAQILFRTADRVVGGWSRAGHSYPVKG